MEKHTWEDVEAAFCGDGTELYFSPKGPEEPTVAGIRRDIDDGLDVEVEAFTAGDEARDVDAFLRAVARETADTSDRRMAEVVGIDPDDAGLVEGYADEIAAARAIYDAWNETANAMLED